MFKPFENDHQSMQIGDLIFENQTDKVIVYGDIDIAKTVIGLEQALQLKTVFNDIATALQTAKIDNPELFRADNIKESTQNGLNFSEQVSSNKSAAINQTECSKDIDNPFS